MGDLLVLRNFYRKLRIGLDGHAGRLIFIVSSNWYHDQDFRKRRGGGKCPGH